MDAEQPPGPQEAFSTQGGSTVSERRSDTSAIRRDRIMIVDDDEAIRRYAGKVLVSRQACSAASYLPFSAPAALRSQPHSQTMKLRACLAGPKNCGAILRHFMHDVTLESEYYEVIPAENGKDALNRIFENPPDLVVVDYKLPEMNGLEFIGKLKSHSHLSRIPSIMFTSTDTEETEIQALNVGPMTGSRNRFTRQGCWPGSNVF
jgi:CheY-like chemotaxis protein